MERGKQNVKLTLTVVSVVSLGKSIHHLISSSPLRMINSHESTSLWKKKASTPSWMEVSSGKSIHHYHFNPFTLKHNTRTIEERITTKQN